MCVYVYKICEKFGGCKKSFSWLDQKVNKKINGGDAFGHNVNDFGSNLCPWLWEVAGISTPFSILIKFEATEYSIRFVFKMFEHI